MDRRVLVWSLAFSVFFNVLTVFFLSHIGSNAIDYGTVRMIESIDYGMILLLSFSFTSVSIGASYSTQSSSFGYLFKYTRASKRWYILNILLSTGITFLILSSVILIINTLLNFEKYGILVLPYNIPLTIAVSTLAGLLLSGITIAIFSIFLKYTGSRHLNYIRFLPVYIYFSLDFAIIESGMHGLYYYLSPFLSATYYIIYSYTGKNVLPFNSTIPYTVNTAISLLSVLIWAAISYITITILISRIPSSYEDARVF